jgi:hypothetical protein
VLEKVYRIAHRIIFVLVNVQNPFVLLGHHPRLMDAATFVMRFRLRRTAKECTAGSLEIVDGQKKTDVHIQTEELHEPELWSRSLVA